MATSAWMNPAQEDPKLKQQHDQNRHVSGSGTCSGAANAGASAAALPAAGPSPIALTSGNVLALQRTAGNRAVQRLLGKTIPQRQSGQQPQDSSPHISGSPIPASASPVIQRYPETILQSGGGVNWESDTTSVAKSGEGISGGVFFFKSNSDPIRSVVVKPEYIGRPQTSSNADRFLSKMGVNVPQARMIAPNSTEAQQIVGASTQKGAPIPMVMKDPNDPFDDGAPVKFFKIMAKSSGSSLASLAANAASLSGVNELVNNLNQPILFHKIGRLVVIDAFMSNRDRISYNMANIGNLMIQGDSVTAIDSDAFFERPNTVNAGSMKDLIALFDKRNESIDGVIKGISMAIKSKEQSEDPYDTSASDHFDDYYGFDNWRAWIGAGYDEAIAELQQLMTSRSRRQDKNELKQNFSYWKNQGQDYSEYDSMRVRGKFLSLRAAGKNNDDALAQTEKYRQYRERRNNRRRGLKWTAKFL